MKTIYVQHNKINSSLFKYFALSNLRVINLSNNNLSKIPDLNRCNNLEFLDISYNQIADNLENISVINTIQTCKLNNNLIDWSQGEIISNLNILIKLVDLKVLNLNNNKFYDKYFSIIDSQIKLKCLGLRVLNDKPFNHDSITVPHDFDFEYEIKKMSEELNEH